MSLDREMPIWCLDPVALADALNLPRHRLLVVWIPEMLDDGIREYHLERIVSDVSKSCRVADDSRETTPTPGGKRSVQKNI